MFNVARRLHFFAFVVGVALALIIIMCIFGQTWFKGGATLDIIPAYQHHNQRNTFSFDAVNKDNNIDEYANDKEQEQEQEDMNTWDDTGQGDGQGNDPETDDLVYSKPVNSYGDVDYPEDYKAGDYEESSDEGNEDNGDQLDDYVSGLDDIIDAGPQQSVNNSPKYGEGSDDEDEFETSEMEDEEEYNIQEDVDEDADAFTETEISNAVEGEGNGKPDVEESVDIGQGEGDNQINQQLNKLTNTGSDTSGDFSEGKQEQDRHQQNTENEADVSMENQDNTGSRTGGRFSERKQEDGVNYTAKEGQKRENKAQQEKGNPDGEEKDSANDGQKNGNKEKQEKDSPSSDPLIIVDIDQLNTPSSSEDIFEDSKKAKMRTDRYCNRMVDGVDGAEGNVPKEFILEHVHMFMRHGDRSPVEMNADSLNNWPSFQCSVDLAHLPKSQKLAAYVKDMDRILMTLSPGMEGYGKQLYPHDYTCGLSQLTGHGAYQMLTLGEYLQKVYIKQKKLLPSEFDPKMVQVQTTKSSRHYQSVLAFLYGFLPTFEFFKLNVTYSANPTFCSTYTTGLSCGCSTDSAMESLNIGEEQMKTSAEINDYQFMVATTLSSKLMISLNLTRNLHSLLDTLNTYVCHNTDFPCSKYDTSQCITWSDILHLWQIEDSVKYFRAHVPVLQNLKLRAIYPVFQDMIQRLQRVIQGEDHSKFVLYSGSDVTMHALATGLGFDRGEWAPYASRIVLEVYSKDHTHYFQVLHDGRDVTRKLAFCATDMADDELCPLDNLFYYFNQKVLEPYGQKFSNWCMD